MSKRSTQRNNKKEYDAVSDEMWQALICKQFFDLSGSPRPLINTSETTITSNQEHIQLKQVHQLPSRKSANKPRPKTAEPIRGNLGTISDRKPISRQGKKAKNIDELRLWSSKQTYKNLTVPTTGKSPSTTLTPMVSSKVKAQPNLKAYLPSNLRAHLETQTKQRAKSAKSLRRNKNTEEQMDNAKQQVRKTSKTTPTMAFAKSPHSSLKVGDSVQGKVSTVLEDGSYVIHVTNMLGSDVPPKLPPMTHTSELSITDIEVKNTDLLTDELRINKKLDIHLNEEHGKREKIVTEIKTDEQDNVKAVENTTSKPDESITPMKSENAAKNSPKRQRLQRGRTTILKTTKSKRKPTVVNARKTHIADEEETKDKGSPIVNPNPKLDMIPELKSFAQLSLRSREDVCTHSQRNMLGFIPRIELSRLRDSPAPLTEPMCVSFPSAVMFVDISGFTKLTEQLTNDPTISSGAETLTKILNGFFDELLAVIETYGGDVVKFCGDAILVVFREVTDLAKLTLCASACAIEVQYKFSNYVSKSGNSFSVHMGIGAGTVHKMYVGGMFNRWEMVFCGEPMLQIKTATDDAKAGETALSPEAWQCVKTCCRGSKLPSGNYLLHELRSAALKESKRLIQGFDLKVPKQLDNSTFLAVRKYVPGAVLARLTAGQSWTEINELRQVTVVFFNTPNLDVKNAEELTALQAVAHAAQNALYYFEGSVNKFLVDDKGSTLIGAFGLPPLAHEDDAVRGLQCGILMKEDVNNLGVKASVGIATGNIFCGILGSETRCEYAVMGDTVNISARLMQYSSPDGILCDENTFTLSKRWLDSRNINCEQLEPIKVKGKKNRLIVYQPEHSLLNHGQILHSMYSQRDHTMIGRSEEIETMEHAMIEFGQNRDSYGGCIWVEGDAGIGKSEYVSYAYHLSAEHSFRMFLGAANSVEQTTSYYPWRTILAQLFSIPNSRTNSIVLRSTSISGSKRLDLRRPHDAIIERVPEVLEEIDHDFVPLVALLNVVLPVEFAETATSKNLPADIRAARTHEMLVRIVQHFASKEPFVITIEDCHWLDSLSLSLLLDVVSRVKPLMMLCTSRPLEIQRENGRKRRSSMIVDSRMQDIPPEYHKIKLLPSTTFMYLDEMEVELLSALVASRISVQKDKLPPLILDVISSKAKGNPFVALELVNHMRETGCLIIKDNNTCEISQDVESVDDIEFPENVRGLITGRVDRLQIQEQLILRIASVIGRVFDYDTLYMCMVKLDSSATQSINLQMLLNDLQNNSFIQYHGMHATKGCDEFRFDMDIVQDVIYNRMSYAHRLEVHLTVASYIEETYTDNLSQHNQLLAHHYKKANDMDKTLHYLSEAGKDALNIHALNEAVKIYSEALKLHRSFMKKTKSREKMNKDDTEALSTVTPVVLAEWYGALASALTDLGDLNKAKKNCEMALRNVDKPYPKNKNLVALHLLEEVIRLYVITKRQKENQGTQNDKVPAEEQRRLLVASEAYSMMSRLTYFSGEQYSQAYSIIRSLNLALKAKKVTIQLAKCYASSCLAASTFSAFAKAENFSQEAIVIAEATQDVSATLYVLIITSLFYIQIGKLSAADKGLVQAMLLASKLGNSRRWEEASNLRAFVTFSSAKYQQAASLYATASNSARKRGDNQMSARLMVGQAFSAAMLCQIETGKDLLKQISSLFRYDEVKRDLYTNVAILAIKAAFEVLSKNIPAAYNNAFACLKRIKSIKNPTQVALLPCYSLVADVLMLLYVHCVRCNETLPKYSTIEGSRKFLETCFSDTIACLLLFTEKFPVAECWLELNKGRLMLLEGSAAYSQPSFEKSRNLAASMGIISVELESRGWLTNQIGNSKEQIGTRKEVLKSCASAGALWQVHLLNESYSI